MQRWGGKKKIFSEMLWFEEASGCDWCRDAATDCSINIYLQSVIWNILLTRAVPDEQLLPVQTDLHSVCVFSAFCSQCPLSW